MVTVLVGWGNFGVVFWASSSMTSHSTLWMHWNASYTCVTVMSLYRTSFIRVQRKMFTFQCNVRHRPSVTAATQRQLKLMLICCSTTFAFQWLHSLINTPKKNIVFGKQNLGHQNFFKRCRGAKQIGGKHVVMNFTNALFCSGVIFVIFKQMAFAFSLHTTFI